MSIFGNITMRYTYRIIKHNFNPNLNLINSSVNKIYLKIDISSDV